MANKKPRKSFTKSIRFTEYQIKMCEKLNIDISETCRIALDLEIQKNKPREEK
jgi:hypothetical protein